MRKLLAPPGLDLVCAARVEQQAPGLYAVSASPGGGVKLRDARCPRSAVLKKRRAICAAARRASVMDRA